MGKEFLLLTKLGLRDFLNLNVIFHTTDPKRKRRALLLGITGAVLVLFLFAYIGAYTYALCVYGMEKLVLPWLFLASSALVFAMGLFHTGGTLFERRSYDLLCSFPLRDSALVLSRFARCDLEYLLIASAIYLPGIVTYGVLTRPPAALFFRFFLCALLAPLLPLCASALFSTVLKLIAGKLRNRSLVEAALTLLFVLGILVLETLLGVKGEELSEAALINLTSSLDEKLAGLYPPCAWAAQFCATGEIKYLCKLIYVNLPLTGAVYALTLRFFRPISQRMGSTERKKGQGELTEKRGALAALFHREWKRYLDSSIYVTNTALGPLMAVCGSAALLFVDVSALYATNLPLASAAPFALCAVLCMMPPASVSLSMEGKQSWISKTLPIPASACLDAKMWMTLSLQLPAALLSSLLLSLKLHPGLKDGVYLFLMPPLFCFFIANLCLTADLHLGSTEWEKEVTVVKQSASAAVGGLSGMLLSALLCVGALTLHSSVFGAFRLALLGLLPLGALLLRRHNIRRLQ